MPKKAHKEAKHKESTLQKFKNWKDLSKQKKELEPNMSKNKRAYEFDDQKQAFAKSITGKKAHEFFQGILEDWLEKVKTHGK